MRHSWASREGSAYPLGVSYVVSDYALNFAIYSRHAQRIVLELYDRDDKKTPVFEYEFDYLTNKSGPVWHCRVPLSEVSDACYYAYRVDGPAPGGGFEFHAFDFEKQLTDPYARTIYFPPEFSREAARLPGSNAGKAPLGVIPPTKSQFDWDGDIRPKHESELIIYEMHIRGFTQHPSSGVDDLHRGTFLGVCEKIPYLRDLGVTAVELMPVFQFDPQEENYWGYMPLNLFAPHHAYSTCPDVCQQRDEFRAMVKSLHAAEIEVILDVVYNHTCEGNRLGPTYNLKGIDNSTYYVATGDPTEPYANFSSTGNTLHTANRAVRLLIVDSMRYWVEEMHVDGFRFDLASIFTRNSDGTIDLDDPPIFGQIGAEDDLADIRLIAEPWDAAGVYQLGRSFPGMNWMQWNASFRDTVQQFVHSDAGGIGKLMTRIYGSSDLFPDDRAYAYRPCQSVNYVASHDGMTMNDLVSYNAKNNWVNGHDNQDGHDDYSFNCGWEGTTNVPTAVASQRKQQIKNLFCLLLLSNGTPMFRMGDEFSQTQQGNSNPYNQDNETSWLNWELAKENNDLLRFVKRMIAFRKSHASISRSRFWRDDIKWYGTDRLVDFSPPSRCIAYCLHGGTENDDDLYVMINGSDSTQTFGIYEGSRGQWQKIVDTSLPSPEDITDGSGHAITTPSCQVESNSIAVLVRAKPSVT
ncbi:MAG: glycogen-debranching protein [Pirellulaceae bacterium]|nr:glycogen-debranching protein [Pirellulaceae bacterium]